jgi:hypothetical protein
MRSFIICTHPQISLGRKQKGPPVPIVQEAGWAPELVWIQRSEEKSLASAGDQTLITLSSSPWPGTILTELPWLPTLNIFCISIKTDGQGPRDSKSSS